MPAREHRDNDRARDCSALAWVARRAAFCVAVVALAAALARSRAAAADGVATPETPGCDAMDVVFVVDTTGSMGGAIADMKREIKGLLELIQTVSRGAYRLGLVTFDDGVRVVEDLDAEPSPAAKKAAIAAAVRGLATGGGTGVPEASDEALNTAINRLAAAGRRQQGSFQGRFAGVRRILILITDTLPGGFDDRFTPGIDDQHASTLAHRAATLGIAISPIYVRTPLFMPTVRDFLNERHALPTGGVLSTTGANGRGTGEAIGKIIQSCGAMTIS